MYLIQDENGQVELAHSISAGLDYPGIGPEHSYYHDIDVCNINMPLIQKQWSAHPLQQNGRNHTCH